MPVGRPRRCVNGGVRAPTRQSILWAAVKIASKDPRDPAKLRKDLLDLREKLTILHVAVRIRDIISVHIEDVQNFPTCPRDHSPKDAMRMLFRPWGNQGCLRASIAKPPLRGKW